MNCPECGSDDWIVLKMPGDTVAYTGPHLCQDCGHEWEYKHGT